MKINWKKKRLKGFTLIELLIAIVIIGVLSGIALPTYMRSVEKSKAVEAVEALSAIAKGEHDYYLVKNRYSDDFSELSISAFPDMAGSEYESEYFKYTLEDEIATATRNEQKYGYKLFRFYEDPLTYCEPEGNTYCKLLGLPASGRIYSMGRWQSCPGGVYPCSATCSRNMIAGYSCHGTYNEDGTFTERVCDSNGYCVTTEFNANQKPKTRMMCLGVETEEGYSCARASVQNYDDEGRLISAYACSNWEDGVCKESGAGQYYDYLDDGKITHQCAKFDQNGVCTEVISSETYRYDSDGNVIAHAVCDNEGICEGTITETHYDNEGNKIVTECKTTDGKAMSCSEGGKISLYDREGNLAATAVCEVWAGTECKEYGKGEVVDPSSYSNDYDGKTQIAKICTEWESLGVCSKYGDEAEMKIYDSEGRLIGTAACQKWDSDNGACTDYGNGLGTVNYYDENNNLIATVNCTSRTEGGECKEFSPEGGTINTYDENHNLISTAECTTWSDVGKECSETGATHYNYYDENGNKTNEIDCADIKERTCVSETETGNYTYDIGTGNILSAFNEKEDISEFYTYDEHGNLIATIQCEQWAGFGVCSNTGLAQLNVYNNNGDKTGEISCDMGIQNGYCVQKDGEYYAYYDMDGKLMGNAGPDNNTVYFYDDKDTLIATAPCGHWADAGDCDQAIMKGGMAIQYDEHGNKIGEIPCSELYWSGECKGYSEERPGTVYTYDQNNNLISSVECTGWDKPGVCGEYSNEATINSYDENNHLVNSATCTKWDSGTGACDRWGNDGQTNTYDTNGNLTSSIDCKGRDDMTGNCKEGSGQMNTYDSNNHLINSATCDHWDSEIGCDKWHSSGGQTNIYDAQGNLTAAIECIKRNEDGSCYNGTAQLSTYDENGNIISSGKCDWVNGSCYLYDGAVTCYYKDTEGVQHEYAC